MSPASPRPGLPRPALFLRPGLLRGIRQSIAGHELVERIFRRLLHEAEQDLQCSLRSDRADNRDNVSSSGRHGGWYAELQEAHRMGRVISRMAVCHAVSGQTELASRCATRMREAATQPTAWDNPMQDLVIAALARSLCVAYDFLYGSAWLGNRSEPGSVAALVEGRLSEMGDWLEYYLVRGGNAVRRNHDVIVACTLGLIALVLREDKVSEEWSRLAIYRLDELLHSDDRYLGKDGDWYESSLRYQLYMLQWFHLFADACRNVGLFDYYSIPKTELLFRALSHFITPNGHNLGFNDTSHDEVIMLGLWPLLKGAIEYQDAKLLCSLQRIIARLPEVPLVAAETMLALGKGSIPSEFSADRDTVMHFRRTGTVVARTDWSESASLFAIECGPYVSHNHLSKGTFEYYHDGQPIILDTGCGHYSDRSRWIVPEMHNVVVVNGGYKPRYPHPLYGDQAWDFTPDFHGRIVDVKYNKQLTFVQADYTAFARTPGAVRNAWFVSPGYLLIEDMIAAKAGGNAEYSAFFHAHGRIRRKAKEKHAIVTTPQGMRIHLRVLEPSQCELSIGQHPFATESMATVKSGGEYRPPPKYMDALDYLKIQAQGQGAWVLVAIIPEQSRVGTARIQFDTPEKFDGGHVFQISVSEHVADVWLFQRIGGLAAHRGLQTDGRVVFVRMVAGQPTSWFVLEGKLLICKGVPLIDSPIDTTFLSR